MSGAARVSGKRILVTGGATGLGAAIVRRVAAEGASLFIADIDEAAGTALATEVSGMFICLNVTSESSWQAAVATVAQSAGGIDGLVNNAGIAASKGAEDIEGIELDDLHRIFAVNVDGMILGCKHAIPLMAKSGPGSIVNLSSVAALIPSSFVVSYGASKAAIAHTTRSVAMHCAQRGYGIRCNSVHPGQIRTSMMNDIIERVGRDTNLGRATAEDVFRAQIPLGQFQEPEDIAHAVLFLLSDEARFITGSQLVVDGGMTLSN